MIRDSDVEEVLRAWLEAGSDRLPDRVAANVIERIPATAQRRSRWSWFRLSIASPAARLAVAAAAIVVAASAAIALLPRGEDIGARPTPKPSTEARSPSPSPSISIAPATPRPAGVMDPGTYRQEAPFRAPFSITFPTPWIARSIGAANAEFLKADSADGEAAWVSVHIVDGVYLDPCHPSAGEVEPVPKTVGALVSALSTMKGFDAGPVTETSVGGLPAKSVTITNSIDTETAGCSEGPMLPMWTFGGGQQAATNGGLTERLWVLSVKPLISGTRTDAVLVIIDGESGPGTPSSTVEEVRTVIESIAFE